MEDVFSQGVRVTTVTVLVDGRCAVAFESYRDRTPLLTIMATRPALLVTLMAPARADRGRSPRGPAGGSGADEGWVAGDPHIPATGPR